MTLTNQEKEILSAAQEHLHKAYSIIMTEFDIPTLEKLSKQAGTDIEMFMMNSDKMMKRLLAANSVISKQDQENIAFLYESRKDIREIERNELLVEQEYERTKLYKIS